MCSENCEDLPQINSSALPEIEQSLSLSVFNVRSLRNKTTQILELLLENDIDVCCMSETWLRKGDQGLIQVY